MKENTFKRYKKAYDMKQSGATLSKIGKEFGVSPERARQMIRRYAYHIDEFDKWYSFISIRTRNALINIGLSLDSKDDIIEAIKKGIVAPNKIKYYGAKSHAELLKRIGIEK